MSAKRLALENKVFKPHFGIKSKVIAAFCAFLVTASLTVPAISNVNADTYVGATSTDYLNVRTGASTSTSVITTIAPDTKVTIIGDKNKDWVQVRLGDGRTGYCFAEYLDIDSVSIKLSPESRDIAVGSEKPMVATAKCASDKIKWESSNTEVLTVSSTGKIKGIGVGTAIVTATNTLTGGSATSKITVKKPDFSKINVKSSSISVVAGKTATIKASTSSNKGKLYYATLNKSIATVTQSGVVKGIKPGTVRIRLYDSTGTIEEFVTVKVTKPVAQKITISPSSAKVAVDASKNLTATTSPANADVKYTSSNCDVVKVSNTGTYSGVSEGTAVISASNVKGDILDTTKVTVKYPDYDKITLTNSPSTLIKGKSFSIGAKPSVSGGKVYHRSSVPSVASVTADGVVKGLKEGTTRIYSYDDTGAVYNNFNLTVVGNSKVTLSKSSAIIEQGTNIKLTARVTPSGTVTWSSSNDAIASVRNGVVSGLRAGTATITAKTKSGNIARCKVTVTAVHSNSKIFLNEYSATMNRTKTLYLQANATTKVTWSSSDTSIATVSDGFVTAKETGKVAITAKDSYGNKTICVVYIIPANPVRFTYTNPNSATLNSTVTFVAITDKKRTKVKFDVNIDGKTHVVNATSKIADGNTYIWKGTMKVTKAGTFNYSAYAYYNDKWSTCSDGKGTLFVSNVTSKNSTAIQTLRASNELISFIAEKEGFLSHYERDQMAYDPVPTVGYGVVVYPGEVFYNSLTRNDAYAWLVHEVNNGSYTSAVNRFSRNNSIKINQYQFDALVSFSYNLGTGWTYGDWDIYDLLVSYGDLNNINHTKLVNTFAMYHHAGGQLYWGLYYRRIDEAEMFLKGDYISDGNRNKFNFNVNTCCVY